MTLITHHAEKTPVDALVKYGGVMVAEVLIIENDLRAVRKNSLWERRHHTFNTP